MREKELEKIKEYKYGFSTDIENIKAPKGLNKEVIKFISNIKKEPKELFMSKNDQSAVYLMRLTADERICRSAI